MGTEKKAMKTVTILLTKYSNCLGRFICAISKNGYSHASISIDEREEVLLQAGAVELKKKESLYLPGQLIDEIVCRFSAKELVYNVI